MTEKDKKTAGADERTPSLAQYFSWVNNAWEGSTEEQTLVNLDYFRWLRDRYGMQLDIYALDAGNFDCSFGEYYAERKEFLKTKFPDGYGKISEAASEIGIKLGMWCGPDGFGNTQAEADARHEAVVSLCRDLGFGLIKIDAACSQLRPEKRGYFCRMMKECREYRPDLILLNHRLELGEGEKYATTFLWQGGETYVDVHCENGRTAPHHRAFTFTRGNTEGLVRLSEDHGVCLSSCMDRFDDDLIFQAFNRNFILAPEIYANPWLLKDEEQAKLAYIYNLHRKYNDILVDGKILDSERYGENAVSRGNGVRRLISLGNASWTKKTVCVRLDGDIGLDPCESVSVIIRHPYISLVGAFAYGDSVPVTVDPFRALLLEVCDSSEAPELLCDGPHRMVGENSFVRVDPSYDIIKLGTTASVPVPGNSMKLYETAVFTADNDSLETRSLRRAGETAVPQIRKAREMFFSQKTYTLKGCDGGAAFDGNKYTFFDGTSLCRFGGLRIDGGCLRVDFGGTYSADRVEFEYFEPDEPDPDMPENVFRSSISVSDDLTYWKEYKEFEITTAGTEQAEIVRSRCEAIDTVSGRRRVVSFRLDSPLRYLRMPSPVCRIYRISLFRKDEEIPLKSPKVNNLFPLRPDGSVIGAQKTVVRVNAKNWKEGSYLAVALEGVHGTEDAYAVAECLGQILGAPDRAPSFPSNVWEYYVRKTDRYYTYYIPVTKDMVERDISVWVLLFDSEHTGFVSDVYLCPPLD